MRRIPAALNTTNPAAKKHKSHKKRKAQESLHSHFLRSLRSFVAAIPPNLQFAI
jgi:hypothetical protein